MRLLPRLSAAFALACGGLLGSAGTASAAWNNVFQVCCNDCGKSRVSYAVPCPQPCPQPQVQVSYIQRTYYQPVTTYQAKTCYKPTVSYERTTCAPKCAPGAPAPTAVAAAGPVGEP